MQFDHAGLVAAFRTFLTAWVAFAVASLLHVENAYWAGMAAWIVMQPTRGILLERGVNRLIGTLIGALTGFTMLHWIPAPYWAAAVLAVWVSLCATLTHVFRRAHTYGAMLAGITAVVVVLPTLHAHEQTYALAQARVTCTLIGVVVATASGFLFVPRAPLAAFLTRLDALTADVVAYLAQVLNGSDVHAAEQQAQRLLDEMAGLEQALAIHVAGSKSRQHHIHHFSALVGAALEVMAAAQARLDTNETGLPDDVQQALQKLETSLRAHVTDPSRPDSRLMSEFDARLADALHELLDARAGFAGLSGLGKPRFYTPTQPEKDYGLAISTGATAGVAIWIASSVALASNWHFAPLAALGVGNFAIILASMDRPHILAPKIFLGVSLGVIAATIFRLFVLPHATSTADVLLMIIPFMIFGALLRASRITSLPAVDYNMCFLLAGQPFLPAETSASLILQGGLALVLGCGFVALVHIFLPADSGRRVRRISALIVRDLERIADLASLAAPAQEWRNLMSQRLIRLSIHLSRIENLESNKPGMVLAALNLAHGLMDLRALQHSPSLTQPEREKLARIIERFRHLSSARGQISSALEEMSGSELRQESRLALQKLAAAFARFDRLPDL
ncbi:FUSC family protein [Propionivibrio limicola]|uniref:FUSC family protein n=1 Tax=Propionivibrio limicola TaxID=167645 RepID=UPI001290A45C|nr:FUSC family protein [Propionivibrio limicola]